LVNHRIVIPDGLYHVVRNSVHYWDFIGEKMTKDLAQGIWMSERIRELETQNELLRKENEDLKKEQVPLFGYIEKKHETKK
jgi:hypothetical protein